MVLPSIKRLTVKPALYSSLNDAKSENDFITGGGRGCGQVLAIWLSGKVWFFIIFIWIITTLIITLDQLIFYKQWVKHHLSSYYKETSLKFLSLNSIMQTTLKEKT
ncbi:MAG: hypothetical protein ACFWTO_13015 [Hafnia paralvei]